MCGAASTTMCCCVAFASSHPSGRGSVIGGCTLFFDAKVDA
jgi:hypothetical protein